MITAKLGPDSQMDVTNATDEVIRRCNPDYALADGRPLPGVLLEESLAGEEARKWFVRWLEARAKEQIDFWGAPL